MIAELLMSRNQFRRIAEGSLRNPFMHSFITEGRVLYTHDGTISTMCARYSLSRDALASIEVLSARRLAAREVIPQADAAQSGVIVYADLLK